MGFPSVATTGKGGKVEINFSDGVLLNSATMTRQASYDLNGNIIANRMHLLGTGKTLINLRPGVEPRVDIDHIVSGLLITGNGANDECQVSEGALKRDNIDVAVAADTSIAFTRPAATQGAWIAISVNKTTGVFTATKGTDTIAGTGTAALLLTYGSAAGEKPLIPVADLLVGCFPVINGAAVLSNADVSYADRELAEPGQLYGSLGGFLSNNVLVSCHVGALPRVVKFTGYYQDTVLVQINSSKSWNVAPQSNTVTETTLGNSKSQTEIGAWNFSFEALADNPYLLECAMKRQGFCSVRFSYPNGGYFQGSGTMVPQFNCAAGAFNNIPVTGSFGDTPVFI